MRVVFIKIYTDFLENTKGLRSFLLAYICLATLVGIPVIVLDTLQEKAGGWYNLNIIFWMTLLALLIFIGYLQIIIKATKYILSLYQIYKNGRR